MNLRTNFVHWFHKLLFTKKASAFCIFAILFILFVVFDCYPEFNDLHFHQPTKFNSKGNVFRSIEHMKLPFHLKSCIKKKKKGSYL